MPPILYRILGLLRAKGGRMAIVGQYKTKKSFLALLLALCIAAGLAWLGFRTIIGNVLYLNLEISAEKSQERIQDMQNVLKLDEQALRHFREITILHKNLSLDEGIKELQDVLDYCRSDGYEVNVLILDPRARLIRGSENDEQAIKSFCDNIDRLLAQNRNLSVVIVTHMGKDPSKGAIGHSRFSGWLDTELKIVKDNRHDKILDIIGRDFEATKIALDFNYPIHVVSEDQQIERKTKVDEAREYILTRLGEHLRSEQKLRLNALKQGITDYAFHTAIRELKDEGWIKSVQAKGRGNKKILKLVDRNKKV